MIKDCIVIAVSAISGGGKSTVVNRLVECLDDAVAIHFDDYATLETYPKELSAWSVRGADFNEFKLPRLAQHIRELRMGQEVTSPVTGLTVAPAKYILFETPLGRAH